MALQRTSIRYKHSRCPHYYLCNYLPLSAGKDTLSYSLLKFKQGRQPDLDGWIDCSLELLAAIPIQPGTTIVRALHHQETTLTPGKDTSLDLLGKALATRFQCRYQPGLLRKSRPSREIKGFSRQQRRTELQDLYYINESNLPAAHPISPGDHIPPPAPFPSLPAAPEANRFLIIDDILTTGTTMEMIIAAIREQFPGSCLTAFTLAKSDYDAQLNQSIPLKGQHYQLEQGAGWLVAEDEETYYSAGQLRSWILADSF